MAYHAVSGTWRSPLAISPEMLDAQLSHLRRRGYAGLTFAESELRRRTGTLPARCVVVTFDDGYRSTLLAADVLAAHGFPGTVFVVTGFVESGNDLRWPGIEHEQAGPSAANELEPLGWAELRQLVERGWEVGSHTVSHPLLTALDDRRLDRELVESREVIRERLGRCDTIAYPYGREDARVAERAAAAGYLAGCTLTGAPRADTALLRPRIGPPQHTSGLRYRLELTRAARAARSSQAAGMLSRMRRQRRWIPSTNP